jgi:hypothetical protein
MEIRGSHLNPAVADSRIAFEDLLAPQRKQARAQMEKRWSQWQAFLATKEGKALSEIAEPAVADLHVKLSMSSHEIVVAYKVFPENVAEQRAEWRGELRVWNRIRVEPLLMRQQLQLLEELEEKAREKEGQGPKASDRGPGWVAPPKEKKG